MVELTGAARAAPPTLQLKNSENQLAAEITPSPVRLPQNPPPTVVGGYGGEDTKRDLLAGGSTTIPARTIIAEAKGSDSQTDDLIGELALGNRSSAIDPHTIRNVVYASAPSDDLIGELALDINRPSAIDPHTIRNIVHYANAASDESIGEFNLTLEIDTGAINKGAPKRYTAQNIVDYVRGVKQPLSRKDQGICSENAGGYSNNNSHQCGVDIMLLQVDTSEFLKINQIGEKDKQIGELIDNGIKSYAPHVLDSLADKTSGLTDENATRLIASKILQKNKDGNIEKFEEKVRLLRTQKGREALHKKYDQLPQNERPQIDTHQILEAANTSKSNEKSPDKAGDKHFREGIEERHRNRKLAVLGAQEKINEQYQRSEHKKKVAENQAAKIEDIRDATV